MRQWLLLFPVSSLLLLLFLLSLLVSFVKMFVRMLIILLVLLLVLFLLMEAKLLHCPGVPKVQLGRLASSGDLCRVGSCSPG